MKPPRIWIEILTLSSAVAVALALLIAVLGAIVDAAGEAFPPQTQQEAASQTYEGMITCSRCGARHSARLDKTAAGCARICLRDGADLVLIDGDKRYTLDAQFDSVQNVIGQRARIAGSIRGNRIRVLSVLQSTP